MSDLKRRMHRQCRPSQSKIPETRYSFRMTLCTCTAEQDDIRCPVHGEPLPGQTQLLTVLVRGVRDTADESLLMRDSKRMMLSQVLRVRFEEES